jgi:Fur family ferric uptake transcriptional regulator
MKRPHPAVKSPLDHHAEARECVRAAGLRVTTARVRVLAELTASSGLLSHQDIEHRLGRHPMDRVTLYRVLDSLVESGLVHRVSGNDRTWRFGVAHGATGGAKGAAAGSGPGAVQQAHDLHAHFQCSDCGKVVCLSEVAAGRTLPVPRGYRAESVELTVRGRCPRCVA